MTTGANGGGAHYTATHVISEAGLSPESDELHPNANRSRLAVWRFTINTEAVPNSLGPRSLIVIEPGKLPAGENLVALENVPASKLHNEDEKKKDVTIFRAWMLASERGNSDRLAACIRKAVEGASLSWIAFSSPINFTRPHSPPRQNAPACEFIGCSQIL